MDSEGANGNTRTKFLSFDRRTYVIGLVTFLWLLFFGLLVYYAHQLGSVKSTGCCTKIELTSSDKTIAKIKAIGSYILTEDPLINEHKIYKHAEISKSINAEHIVFNSVHGWRVYPEKPINFDDYPGSVRFAGCRQKCPDKCSNDGLWTYYDNIESEFKPDYGKSLQISCTGNPKADPTAVIILSICFLISTTLLAVSTWYYCVPSSKKLNCFQGNGDANLQTEEQIALNTPPAEAKEPKIIEINVQHPNSITFPVNKILITATCNPEPPYGHPYHYNWSIVRTKGIEGSEWKIGEPLMKVDDTRGPSVRSLPNLEEGTYKYMITVTGSQPKPKGSKGVVEGEFNVFPETSVTIQLPGGPSTKLPFVKAELNCKIWQGNSQGINSLPEYLKGSKLFQLPYDDKIPLRTKISIITGSPSELYIAHENEEKKGWFPHSLDGTMKEYEIKMNKKTGSVNAIYVTLSKIWHTRIDAGKTLNLPATETKKAVIAIFIVESTNKNDDKTADVKENDIWVTENGILKRADERYYQNAEIKFSLNNTA